MQYAKAFSLRVLGIDAGPSKAELCAKLGADVYMDFTKTQVTFSSSCCLSNQCLTNLASKDLAADVISATQGGAHGVLVVSSSPKAYEQAIRYVRKTGALVCIGISECLFQFTYLPSLLLTCVIAPTPMQFPVGPEYFVAKGVRLMGSSTGTMIDTQEALEFVRNGKVKPITVKKNLEDIQDCLRALEGGDVVGCFIATFG